MRLFGFLLLVFVGFGGPAHAHDPGLSTAQIHLQRVAIEVTSSFAPADIQALVPSVRSLPETDEPTDSAVTRAQLVDLAGRLWQVQAGTEALAPNATRVQRLAKDNITLIVTYSRPDRGLTLRAMQLAALPPGHRQYATVYDEHGTLVEKRLLSAEEDTLQLEPGTSTTTDRRATFQGLLRLGIEHIWTGYDHLLFLCALLFVCRSCGSIAAIISCFTLGHSLTLALATFNLVALPGRWVEPAIAGSIVFVGVENLIRGGAEPPGRWVLTFVFGLVHGLGFASVLRDLGVGGAGQGVVMPLLAFNLGVEVGQIAIAAAVLPLVWQLRKRKTFVRRGVPALSCGVVLAGGYWLVERTIFG